MGPNTTGMDTAAHLNLLAQALQRLAGGLVYWSGVGFLDTVPQELRDAVGEEWGPDSVQGYLAYQTFANTTLHDATLTVVLAAPCPPDQLAAVQALQASGKLSGVVILERRKPAAWGGWSLPASLGPLLKRHSATGEYLDEIGFQEAGWIEWESTEKCHTKLGEALLAARRQTPGYVVVSCEDSGVESEDDTAVYPAPRKSKRSGVVTDVVDTVFGRFSKKLSSLVARDKIFVLDESALGAPDLASQHLRMFRSIERPRVGKPVLVLPSALLPSLYADLRSWCQDREAESPLMVIHGSGIPARREAGSGGLTDGHLLMSIPGLTLARPSDELDARSLFHEVSTLAGPAALLFSQAPAVGLNANPQTIEGCGRRLREGEDVAILALGSAVFPSLLAAESLQTVGLKVAVYDLRYRRPLDLDLLRDALNYPVLVTVEEHPVSGSFTSQLLSTETWSGRLLRLSVEVAELERLLAEDGEYPLTLENFGLHAEGISRSIKSLLHLGGTAVVSEMLG